MSNSQDIAMGDVVTLEEFTKYIEQHLPIFVKNMSHLKVVGEKTTIQWGRLFTKWMDFDKSDEWYENMNIRPIID